MVDEQATPVAAAGDGVRPVRSRANPDGVAGRSEQMPLTLTVAKQRVFLDALAATGCVEKAAAEAGHAVGSFYGLRRRNEVFKAQWKDALEAGYDAVEGMLLRYILTRGEERPEGADDGADGEPDDGADGEPDDGADGERGEAGATDATDGDRAAGSARRRFRHGVGEVTEGLPTWAHVAIALLNRHRANIEGSGRARGGTATREEASAMLRKRLDQLARSLKGAP